MWTNNCASSAATSGDAMEDSIGWLLDDAKSSTPQRPKVATTRTSDLEPLLRDFARMQTNLRALIVAAEHYRKTMLDVAKARLDVSAKLSTLSVHTPFYEPIGGKDASLIKIARDSFQAQNKAIESYEDSVIKYCKKWQEEITQQVSRKRATTKELRDQLTHYQDKVTQLRQKIAKAKKTPPRSVVERLARNETKLDQAWRNHDSIVLALCELLYQITNHGWKELYPLARGIFEFEGQHATDGDILTKLPPVNKKLKWLHELQSSRDEGSAVSPDASATTWASSESSSEKDCVVVTETTTNGLDTIHILKA